MSNLRNLSRYAATDLLSTTKEGRDALLICAAGRFQLPDAGVPTDAPPAPTDEQPPVSIEDVYFGEPGTSSLRYEGQSAYYRPGTDIYLTGHAWAPQGRPVKEMTVSVRVSSCEKEVLVLGDRVWNKSWFGTRMSLPKPFECMPLVYERAFGGGVEQPDGKEPKWEPRNPVGCGLYRNRGEADGRPAPNLEDPSDRISRLRDRPTPQGFGPLARSWQPRLGFAGTYDERWINERAPLWPLDFDERFFCAAPTGLTTRDYLQGGEPVALGGVSPDGAYEFPLPRVRLVAKAMFPKREARRLMTLDAVQFEPDEKAFTLIWRATFSAHKELFEHQVTLVRELESWEELPE